MHAIAFLSSCELCGQRTLMANNRLEDDAFVPALRASASAPQPER